ncbi:MAG: DUF1257 domain-containing protein [Rhodospirillaceae bacterium]|jgi:hypothetical protein|nr:DUF1257 domain-containing protein [Alphaproteobacteria bacterium]MBT3535861.1 DUF1257 domain-containing protein [Rhodospirillaceae bacterium]MBT4486174.1 DUF1257 domain-containing protein [Rhodospirillaceae bacterium]MBT5193515.1 DUF1257 domain-containing protein [Rhodospirillaceae bacterium]MBT5455519.1 DUF1257 domain-containing protein [Rhodospirillaceae bacterium]
MSHFSTMQTAFVSEDHLIAALADVGFENVEHHEFPQNLYGWKGDRRQQTAEVIVRREFIGATSNDIGFARTADGTFKAIISEFDARMFDAGWLGRLSQRYAYRAARDTLAEQGFDLVEESMDEAKTIRMTVRRMA